MSVREQLEALDRDGLVALADDEGLKVDRRLGDEKLRDSIAAQLGDESDLTDAAATEVVAEQQPDEHVDDGWPQRIAPCAWLDQDGNRYTDMGEAHEAAQRIRERG